MQGEVIHAKIQYFMAQKLYNVFESIGFLLNQSLGQENHSHAINGRSELPKNSLVHASSSINKECLLITLTSSFLSPSDFFE